MSARALDLGYAPVLALRVTYLGELGYELHVPAEYALDLYERLRAAGERYDIANAGYRAINSLRLEKHYLVWGSDITPDYNPYEAGLGFCVAQGKDDFLGRAALAEVKARGPKQKLAWFTAPPELNLFGGEIVLSGERVLGRVTSGGYGYTVGRNILCAYVAAEESVASDYAVEVMGERFSPSATRGRCTIPTAGDSRVIAMREKTMSPLTPSSTPARQRHDGHGMPRAFYHTDALYAAELQRIWAAAGCLPVLLRDSAGRGFPHFRSRWPPVL
jgi:4-methylaminobutanoate oxidase (formaldehyde-forming)